jgi:glycosyltransferase involved in cell wall biosynthesis
MKLIIQIPCFNEEEMLPFTLSQLPKHIDGIDEIEILISDDGSTDRTVEVAKELAYLLKDLKCNINLIPYNNVNYKHTANLRVLNTVSDMSDISQRLFPGQFYRWTIQLELHDGFLFNMPYKTNMVMTEAAIGIDTLALDDSIIDREIENIEFNLADNLESEE